MERRIKLLTFNGVYKPGYKGGGPVKSIANMAEALFQEFDFYIVASDRDFGDFEPYKNVKVNEWNQLNFEKVFYHSGETVTIKRFLSIIKSIDHDVVYLQGYYSNYTRKYLLLSKLKLVEKKPIVLCPRGDFSEGKGNSFWKKLKKQIYISVLKILGFNKNIIWHATSSIEKEDIIKKIGRRAIIVEAPNIPTKPKHEFNTIKKEQGKLDLVYISRINRKKNLLTAIKLLTNLKGKITFSIYGPIFDNSYWEECKREIQKLPNNIKVQYMGSLDSSLVSKVLSENHFLLFPTNGENFGHIIYESLCSGCPVIISNNTPWKNLSTYNVGWDIPLIELSTFQNKLQECVDMNNEQYLKMRESSYRYAKECFLNDVSVEKTKELLLYAAKQVRLS